MNGPFLDFALEKRSLLLNADPKLTTESQVNLIVASLPRSVWSSLRMKDIDNVDTLMSALGQIEPLKGKISNERAFPEKNDDDKKTPCTYCANNGFPNRLHPETVCRLKARDQKKMGNDKIKMTNNVEIQESIAIHNDAKNLIAPHL